MSENSQNNPAIIGEKQGVPIYKVNPSVPDANSISKRKKVQYGNEQKGFIVDSRYPSEQLHLAFMLPSTWQ